MSTQKKDGGKEEAEKGKLSKNDSLTDPLTGRYHDPSIGDGELFKIPVDGSLISDYLEENRRILKIDDSIIKIRPDGSISGDISKITYRPNLTQVNDHSAHLETSKLFELPKIAEDMNFKSLLRPDTSPVSFLNNPPDASIVDRYRYGTTSSLLALQDNEETEGEKIKKLQEEIEALKRESMEKRDEGNKEIETKIRNMERRLEEEKQIYTFGKMIQQRKSLSEYYMNNPLEWRCHKCGYLIATLDSLEKIEDTAREGIKKCKKDSRPNKIILNNDGIHFISMSIPWPTIDRSENRE